MTNSFGPWTTELTKYTDAQLSTFWKRRMAQIGNINTADIPRTLHGTAGLVVLGMAMVLLPTWHGIAAPPILKPAPAAKSVVASSQPVGKNESATFEKLKSACKIHWTELGLSDCLQQLAEATQMRIRLDEPALQGGTPLNTPITLRLSGVYVTEVLQLLLEPAGWDWIIQEEGLLITSRAKADEHICERTYDVGDLIRRNIPAAEIARVLEAFVDRKDRSRDDAATTFTIENGAFTARLTQRSHRELELMLIKVRDAYSREQPNVAHGGLATITYPLGDLVAKGVEIERLIREIREHVLRSTWMESGGPASMREFEKTTSLVVRQNMESHERFVHILSTLRRLSRDAPEIGSREIALALVPPNGDTSERAALLELLNKPVTLDLQQNSLTDLVSQFNRLHGGFFFLDVKAIEAGGRGRTLKEPITLQVNGATLRSALNLILEPRNLDWTIHAGRSIRIATADQIDSVFEVVVYPVRKLASPQLSEAQLVERVTANAVRATWDTAGGRRSIRALPGLLVVKQNRRGHDAVAQALSDEADRNSK